MTMIKKCIDIAIKKKDEDNRIITFIASTGDLDRDGEMIKPSAWDIKRYKKNPVFLWGHWHSEPPIGKAVNVSKDDDALVLDVEFPTADVYPFADTIYKLYKEGFLNAVSVGFMPIEWKDGDPDKKEPRRTYSRAELLEVSGVTVPSNYNALVSARSAGTINDHEFVKMKAFMEGYSKNGEEETKEEIQETGAEQPAEKSPILEIEEIETKIAMYRRAFESMGDVISELGDKLLILSTGIETILKRFEQFYAFNESLEDVQIPLAQSDEGNEQGKSECYFDALFNEASVINEKLNDNKEAFDGLVAIAQAMKGKL